MVFVRVCVEGVWCRLRSNYRVWRLCRPVWRVFGAGCGVCAAWKLLQTREQLLPGKLVQSVELEQGRELLQTSVLEYGVELV